MKTEVKTETKKYLFGLIKRKKKYASYNLDSIKDFFDNENEIEMMVPFTLKDLKIKRISKTTTGESHLSDYVIAVEDSTSVMYLNTDSEMFYNIEQWNRIASLKENDCIDVIAYRSPGLVGVFDLKNKTLEEKV